MFQAPNYTQIPNQLFDELIPTLKEGELRVLLVIMRQTFGWHKDWDRIPITQLMKKTGMERMAVCRATSSLVKKGMVKKTKTGACGTEQVYYSLCTESKQENDEIMPKIETNSNKLYQYPKDTGTSILKIPSKETLPKEKEKEIYKEKSPEPKRSKRSEYVYLSDPEYQDLVKLFGGVLVESKILAMDRHISEKRNDKPFKNSYIQLKSWCNDEKNKAKQNPLSKSFANEVVNIEFIKDLMAKCPKLVANGTFSSSEKYFELVDKGVNWIIYFSENGFVEQVKNQLRKWNIKHEL